MNGLSVCLDEIALEGLDGITLSTLWKRLNSASTTPRLLSSLDNSYKVFLWNSIRSQDVQTFLLKEPREKFESFADDAKVYPFLLIDSQGSGGIRGSCSTFHSREFVDVSKDSLDVVVETYGDRLVLVASQVMRERVLFHSEFDTFVEVSDVCYCLIEWIGRARNLGRLQSRCPTSTGIDGKTIFYNMKILHRQQVVTKQTVLIRGSKTSVLYLPRFHDEHMNDNLASSICTIVEKKPGKSASVEDLCACLDESRQAIMKSLSLLLERGHIKSNHTTGVINYLPLLGDEETPSFPCDFSNGFTLIQSFYNKLNDEDDDDEDEEEIYSTNGNCEFVLNIPAEVPLLNHVYQLIVSKGVTGITLAECHGILGLPWYDVRAALKQLESSQRATVIFEDIGRQRKNRYIATNIFKEHQRLLEQPLPKEDQSVETRICQNKYMETDGICNEVKEYTPKPVSSPINILETTKKEHRKSFGFTEKFQKRRKMITDFLDKHKVVVDEYVLKKLIIDKEAESGLVERMDSRTFPRFLRKLKDSRTIQIFKIDVDLEGKTDSLNLICDIKIEKDSPEVLAEVDMHKKKTLSENRIKEAMQNNIVQKEIIKNSAKLGYLPKMPRAEMLHIFLYIMIYELVKPDINMQALRLRFDWIEHLTPSHCLKDHSEGWFTSASILVLLPLSLYVRLIGLSYQVPLVDQYLSNPLTKHMLIKDLPESLSCQLTDRKRNLPSLMDTLSLLAKMNLLTPTTKSRFNFAKDIVCHLNKRAALLDTRISLPGYSEVEHPAGNQFPEVIHHFSSLSDVIDYWSSTRDICLSTHLGVKSKALKGKDCIRERGTGNLKSCIKDEEDLYADIKPIGDGLGAAGLDSGIFSHLRRNWIWTSIGKAKKHPLILVDDTTNEDWQECFATTTVPAHTVSRHTGGKGVKRKLRQPAENGKPTKKILLPHKDAQQSELLQQNISVDSAPIVSHVKITRPSKIARVNKTIRMKAKEAVKRAHWSTKNHDKRDIDARKRNEVLRVTFTPQEQKLLFICTLALRILGKKSTDTGYTDWLWTRDILYKDNFESAKAKTALSISRKYRTIMRDPQTKVNLNICTSDCKQEKEFQPFCNLGKSCDEVTFNELVELLKKKYSMENMKTTPLFLPHNLKAFQRQNNIQTNLQPRKPGKADKDIMSLKAPVATLFDVRQGLLRDSIVSALLMNDEKYDPNVAYVFLDQFAEEELSLAVSELKKNKMVTRALLRYGQGRNLALTTFSQTISTAGQRILDAHFAPSVVQEAICFYHQLQQSGFHSHSLLALSEDLHGGCVAGLFTLLSAGKLSVEMEFPENILYVGLCREKKDVEDIPIDTNSSQVTAKKLQAEEPALVSTVTHNNLTREVSSSPNVCITERDKAELISQDMNGRCSPEEAQETHLNPEKASVLPEVLCNISNNGIQEPSNMNMFETINKQMMPSTKVKASNMVSGNKDVHHEDTIAPGNGKQLSKAIVTRSTIARSCHLEQNVNQSYTDVLSGIEDHLFGNFGQLQNMQNYEVELQSKSSFSCCFTTPHVGSVSEMGEHGLRIKTFVGPVTNIACDNYNEKILPARTAGTMIRPLIRIHPCTVKVSLLSSAENEAASQTKPKESMALVAEYFKVNAHILPKQLDECLNICSKEFCFADKDCQALATVYKSIESGKEIGVTRTKLERMVKQCDGLSNFSLAGLIKVLKSFSLVYEVGFVEVCFVTHIFKKHWALPLPCMNISHASSTADQERIITGKKQEMFSHTSQTSTSHAGDIDSLCDDKVQSESIVGQSITEEKKRSEGTQTQHPSPISRPWFCMDGRINKIAYNTFHESVLRYIMQYPGIEEFAIAKHFVNMIFPVTLNCILETLEDNQCILKKCSIKKSHATLFSSAMVRGTNVATESIVTYFLPTADAIIKLADCVFL